jgi:hypothetical protein
MKFHAVLCPPALAFAALAGFAGPVQADLSELNDCRTPHYILISSAPAASGYQITRSEWYQGASLPIVRGSNPEGNPEHDPGHLQNCTEGAQWNYTQWLTFKFQAQNWFSSANEDHVAIVLRGFFDGLGAGQTPTYDGRGMIFHRFWGGVMGERYAANIPGAQGSVEALGNDAQPGFLQDYTTYQVEMHASPNGVAYRVTNVATGQAMGWRYYGNLPNDPPTYGSGLGFAVLCPAQQSPQCTAPPGFRIYFWEIATGWFAP